MIQTHYLHSKSPSHSSIFKNKFILNDPNSLAIKWPENTMIKDVFPIDLPILVRGIPLSGLFNEMGLKLNQRKLICQIWWPAKVCGYSLTDESGIKINFLGIPDLKDEDIFKYRYNQAIPWNMQSLLRAFKIRFISNVFELKKNHFKKS